MAEKKIVSIEERIPKLKEARKKKANRRLIIYLSIFFIMIALILYLQSPLSHVKQVIVKGNSNIETETIQQKSGISKDDNFWNIDKSAIVASVSNHPEVKSVQVDKRLPNKVILTVDEYNRVGYVKTEDAYYPILETGQELSDQEMSIPNGDAPLLIGWDKRTYLEELTKELVQLPASIANKISEIRWTPTESNPYKIHLYMSDGYEVDASIRNFSNKMRSYPSIVAQLDEQDRGIIHIDVGAYFESYENGETKEVEEEE
ncbi:cell division protein FtsQ [Pontibacillus halophilus JSM 076056 = DSM 19796]|uniref:Cell division protein DivIB n=1 Tax=Pontibacillus halophilus JSM 076056 = DSM 19796 TaxID=1385510 RepID=A0A0A5GQ08_9BACI|nr:cell division protein FtsQ/DivIB [Pontibacillus halophilus]KGX93260.1 cell division protein FtsQ [Pontibacillus halophilus JSM 076056 = DSM 19796]